MALLLAVRFLAEVGMLACLGIGGWQVGNGLLQSVLLGVGLPLLAAVIWGRWVAPRAHRRLRDPARLAVEVTMFAAALMLVLRAGPSPAMPVLGIAVWAAFLVSIPSRGHEPVLAGRSDAKGVE